MSAGLAGRRVGVLQCTAGADPSATVAVDADAEGTPSVRVHAPAATLGDGSSLLPAVLVDVRTQAHADETADGHVELCCKPAQQHAEPVDVLAECPVHVVGAEDRVHHQGAVGVFAQPEPYQARRRLRIEAGDGAPRCEVDPTLLRGSSQQCDGLLVLVDVFREAILRDPSTIPHHVAVGVRDALGGLGVQQVLLCVRSALGVSETQPGREVDGDGLSGPLDDPGQCEHLLLSVAVVGPRHSTVVHDLSQHQGPDVLDGLADHPVAREPSKGGLRGLVDGRRVDVGLAVAGEAQDSNFL